MPNNPTRLEAAATRRLLAATTPKERTVRALVLMAIQLHQETPSGEEATAVASSPVGASACRQAVGASAGIASTPPPSLDSRADVARPGYHSLDPVALPPEISVSAGSAATPARRTGQRA